jgi:phospholipid-binding lipoprotein MlaA
VKLAGLSRSFAAVLLASMLVTLTGCATLSTTISQVRGGPGQKLDPWENWNRKVFAFNEALDEAVLKPVATGYTKVVPSIVRTGIGNFFGNFADAWSGVNNLLQGKLELAFRDVFRVGTNSLFGVFGLMDVAGELGMERQYEDLGQTLGYWGVGPGAYVVWPLLGPSTVRESIALPFDRLASPAVVIDGGGGQLGITVLQIINTRAGLLGASRLIDDIALDKYTFLRDAYLQRRRSLVLDGNEKEEDEPEPAAPAAPAPAAARASGVAPAK